MWASKTSRATPIPPNPKRSSIGTRHKKLQFVLPQKPIPENSTLSSILPIEVEEWQHNHISKTCLSLSLRFWKFGDDNCLLDKTK